MVKRPEMPPDRVLTWEEMQTLTDEDFERYELECYGYKGKNWYRTAKVVYERGAPRWEVTWLQWAPVPPKWRVVRKEGRKTLAKMRSMLELYERKATEDFVVWVETWVRFGVNQEQEVSVKEVADWLDVGVSWVLKAADRLQKTGFLRHDGVTLSLVK
jgi:hypothetical protein